MDTNTQTTELTAAPVKDSETARGVRGELGVATPGLLMRQRWKAEGGRGSLKQFARRLLKEGDTVAKEWFANKRGAKNQVRSDKSIQRIAAERTATKAAKRKSSKK